MTNGIYFENKKTRLYRRKGFEKIQSKERERDKKKKRRQKSMAINIASLKPHVDTQ